MIYYELLEDGTIDRSTNNIKVAQMNGYYNENHVVENEEDIVYGYDNKRYLKGQEPVKPQELIDKENAVIRIEELDNWFKTDYATYEQMFVRRKTLGIEDTIVDDFRNKTYHNLIELYEEAEIVAKEIRNLRK